MGARLAAGITEIGGDLAYEVAGNMVFARLTRAQHAKAKARGAIYNLWGPQPMTGDPDQPMLARFVASWSTTEADVDALLATFTD